MAVTIPYPQLAVGMMLATTAFPDKDCPAQKCFVDNIESWSINEITINWNAPFAWVTAFMDEKASPQPEWTWYYYFPILFKN